MYNSIIYNAWGFLCIYIISSLCYNRFIGDRKDKMNKRDQLKRKLVFDRLDVTLNRWLEFDIDTGHKKKFIERSIESGIVNKDELVEHFMYKIVDL
jgi:hypothetical protein